MKSIVTSIAASSLLDAKKGKNSSWAGVSAILLLLLSLPRLAAAQDGTFSPTGNANSLPGTVQAEQATSETQARLAKAYGRIPLSFEANQGQTDAQVKFVSRSRD